MAVLNNVPIPLQDPISRPRRVQFGNRRDPLEGTLSDVWVRWFDQLGLVTEQAPSRIATVELTAQAASISATDMTDGTLSAGLYEVKFYARITQAGTVSSSLTVTLDWTDGGVTPSFSGAAITGNTTTTFQSETKLIRIDSTSPVRYSTTYASVGATPMNYSLDVVLNEVRA